MATGPAEAGGSWLAMGFLLMSLMSSQSPYPWTLVTLNHNNPPPLRLSGCVLHDLWSGSGASNSHGTSRHHDLMPRSSGIWHTCTVVYMVYTYKYIYTYIYIYEYKYMYIYVYIYI